MNHFFITGTSRGLGKGLAELCLAKGDVVTGISRGSSISHQRYLHIHSDLSCREELMEFRFPDIDESSLEGVFLVNNGGTVRPVKYAGKAETEDIFNTFTLNLIAPAILSNLFIKKFCNFAGQRAIVNISSGAGDRPVDGWSIYCSTKAGLNMLTRVTAMEQEKLNTGFNVVAIAPGVVDTDMQGEIRKVEAKDFSRVEEFMSLKEEHQLTSPEEAAKKIIYAIKKLNQIQDVVFSVKS